MRRAFTSLSIAFPGGSPPSEFCIFTAGQVETTKGTFTFDADCADSVMADYVKHGIDLMIDYDHASLSLMSVDPALSGKAAGWFNIEVRNGELWAVNVRWTEPAAAALQRKEWRFMSPAFNTDEAGRICSLLNVAITNLPATRKLEPLMAASVHALGASSMNPDQVKAALEALVAGDDAKCAEILKAMIAAAAGGDAPADPAAADEGVAATEAPDAPDPEDKKKEEPAAVAASVSKMMRLSESRTFAELASKFETYRRSHVELETERQAFAKEREVIEAAERRRGCVDLVTLAKRAPATVWADDKSSGPKKYLAAMSIADFRDYVADAVKAAGGKTPAPPRAGAKAATATDSGPIDVHGLTAHELHICKEQKCDPATFAALKARGIKA